MNMNALSSLSQGWIGGYMFSKANSTEGEYRQGGNPYIVAVPQAVEAIYCETALRPLTQLGLRSGIAKVVSVFCSWGLVAFPFLAVSYLQDQPVKEGASILRKAVHFTAACIHKYSGKVLWVALAAAAVALTIFGNPYLGGAILAALTYHAVDSLGLIPQKISSFMEKYMAVVASGFLVITGGPIVKIVSAFSLMTYCTPLKMRVIRTYERILLRGQLKQLALVGAVGDPVVQNKKLPFEAISRIMNAPDNHFAINAAYTSKPCINSTQFPHNYHFEELNQLMDKVDWEANGRIVMKKLQDDDRFLDMLKKEFPQHADNPIAVFDSLLQELAGRKELEGKKPLPAREKVTVERYAATYVKEQMKLLSKTLQCLYGSRVSGSQSDLEDSIENVSMILHYLKSLDYEKNKIEVQDILLKLAVEGGDYCPRGIKRAAREIMASLSTTLTSQGKDPMTQYEEQLQRQLEVFRYQLLQSVCQAVRKIPGIRSNVHLHDLVFNALAIDFYPLSSNDLYNFDSSNFMIRSMNLNTTLTIRQAFKANLGAVVDGMGKRYFWEYITKVIGENELLTPEQKALVLDMSDTDKAILEKKEKALYRLMFVMLGILCYKP